MDFENILNALKAELTTLFGEKWQDLKAESKADINQFLEASKVKLQRWTALLTDGAIDLDDFQWLVKSQKDLLLMQALHSAGVHRISLGHFKNKVLETVISVIKTLVL